MVGISRHPLRLTLVAAVALLLALVVLPAAPAQADATTCAWSHGSGGNTCLAVRGSGTFVSNTRVSHTDGAGWVNICYYRADNWGTHWDGSGHYRISSISPRCVPPGAYVDFWVGEYFANPSYYYGSFYHDGSWAPGAPRVTIHS